jgi:hypothetical protein
MLHDILQYKLVGDGLTPDENHSLQTTAFDRAPIVSDQDKTNKMSTHMIVIRFSRSVVYLLYSHNV